MGIPHTKFLSWDITDQDKALAWTRNQNITCSSCGTKEEDWKDDYMRFAPLLVKCRGCEVKALGRKEIPEDGEGYQVMLVEQPPATDDEDSDDMF